MSHIKHRSQSGYFIVPESKHKALREISQPVKIAKLLGPSQSSEKNTDLKISLPERLTPYLRSSKKKNRENTYTKFHHGEKNVRRNLDFTETQTAVEGKKSLQTQMCNVTEKLPEEKDKLYLPKKRFLLPPNTIKDFHIKNILEPKISVYKNSPNVKTNSEKKHLRIVKDRKGKGCLLLSQNSNVHTDSVIYEKSNKTPVKQYISSQTLNLNDQSGINILHSSNSDLADMINDAEIEIAKNDKDFDNDFNVQESDSKIATEILKLPISRTNTNTAIDLRCNTDKIREKNIHSTDKRPLATLQKYEDLHLLVQGKTISDSYMNSQQNTNDSEYVILNKAELTDLASKLKLLISRLEEDVSNSKLTLAIIMNMLSAVNVTSEETTESSGTTIKQKMITHSNSNAEEMNSTNIKSLSSVLSDATYVQNDNVLKETCETSHFDLSKDLEVDTFKENSVKRRSPYQINLENNKKKKEIMNSGHSKFKYLKDRRSKSKFDMRSTRSACLRAKTSNNLSITNDSFENLENELCIVKSDATSSTVSCTPIPATYENKKVGRPLKEYMALKSRMSCLLTPNMKQFNSINSEHNAHPESVGAKASLSNKILVELSNLYADSPEAQ